MPRPEPFVVQNAACPACGALLLFSREAGLVCPTAGCGGPGSFQARLVQVPAGPRPRDCDAVCECGHPRSGHRHDGGTHCFQPGCTCPRFR